MTRPPTIVGDETGRYPAKRQEQTAEQLPLPFLTDDEVVALDVITGAVDRAVGLAVQGGRLADAAELAEAGAHLIEIRTRNAAAVRAHR